MKTKTIIKSELNGDVSIPEELENDMIKSGSNLPNMVKELRANGWRTFEHHDNWIREKDYEACLNKTISRFGFDVGEAYDIMLKEKSNSQ